MKFFLSSILCWIKHNGHCWHWTQMSVIKTASGTKAEIMKCVHCGSETRRIKTLVRVK